MQTNRQPVPIVLKFKKKHIKSIKTAHFLASQPSRHAIINKKRKGMDVDALLKEMHETELSIYQEQLSVRMYSYSQSACRRRWRVISRSSSLTFGVTYWGTWGCHRRTPSVERGIWWSTSRGRAWWLMRSCDTGVNR